HREPLWRGLFTRHYDVDIIAAAQTVVGYRQERVGVRRQVDADDLRLLVDDVIDEAGVLMTEAIMVLPPDVRAEQGVERGSRPPPRNVLAHLEPLGVLVEHGINDVDKRLVAAEEAMPAGQEVALQPALALVLAEHFHHPAIRTELVVLRIDFGHVAALGYLQH